MRRVLMFLGGIIAGSSVGAIIALFFAPQSGDEMRDGAKTRIKRIQEHSAEAAVEYEAQLRRELAELTGAGIPTEE